MGKCNVKAIIISSISVLCLLTSCNINKQRVITNNSPRTSSPAIYNNNNTTKPAINNNRTTQPAIIYKKPKLKPPQKNIIISIYKTKLLDKNRYRIFNIIKASKRFKNYTLKPNTIFSFNKVVGERGSKNGYKQAKIIVKGKREEAIGGGICQLSSTIYNAVFPLKLPILERHNHTGDVHYLPQGKDAAVQYDSLDLKFKNTYDYPIRFNVYIKNGYLYVEVIKVGM